MSAVTEWVVREYFEMMGYMVTQPRKHSVPGRAKKADEEVDLIVCKATIQTQVIPDEIVWMSDDLAGVRQAIVGVRGWHTDRFYTSTFEQTPDILRFVKPASVKFAASILGSEDMAKILCIPKLPASGDLKEKTTRFLREQGVDGVIAFPTILAALIAGVDSNKNYEKSDLLQIIRLLKNYDLLRDEQMELFTQKRPARRPAARKPKAD